MEDYIEKFHCTFDQFWHVYIGIHLNYGLSQNGHLQVPENRAYNEIFSPL